MLPRRRSPRLLPLLVGQAPSRSAGHARAFDGESGRRLARLLDVPSLFDAFETVNLLRRWPGKHGGRYAYRQKGDRFPRRAARRSADRLRATFPPGRVVVLCGSRVARAFGIYAGFLQWVRLDWCWALVLPHPSGCNLWWNDPANRESAEVALRCAMLLAKAEARAT
jgi:uracil-DNA glycosylase